MSFDHAEFVRKNTFFAPVQFVPEISLYQAREVEPVWHAAETCLHIGPTEPPYWSFAWAGGVALARYILDHPDVVRGLRVLDFASGSGLVGIAAAKSGAKQVLVNDIDPIAETAATMNAERNDVTLETLRALDMTRPFKGADLIVAGDVCYEQAMSIRVMRWLRLSAEAGTRVLLGDPGRAYAPKADEPNAGLEECASYEVPVLRSLEDRDVRHVTIWQLCGSL